MSTIPCTEESRGETDILGATRSTEQLAKPTSATDTLSLRRFGRTSPNIPGWPTIFSHATTLSAPVFAVRRSFDPLAMAGAIFTSTAGPTAVVVTNQPCVGG
jgi:hypothetical protein